MDQNNKLETRICVYNEQTVKIRILFYLNRYWHVTFLKIIICYFKHFTGNGICVNSVRPTRWISWKQNPQNFNKMFPTSMHRCRNQRISYSFINSNHFCDDTK